MLNTGRAAARVCPDLKLVQRSRHDRLASGYFRASCVTAPALLHRLVKEKHPRGPFVEQGLILSPPELQMHPRHLRRRRDAAAALKEST